MNIKTLGLSITFLFVNACAIVSPDAIAQSKFALFDGDSLAGWKTTTENPSSFRVEDGAIVAEGPRAHLFYDGEHGTNFVDFVLTLKVKTTPGSNSGVYFHTAFQETGWPNIGMEAQVNASQSDFRKTGSIYAVADVRAYDDGTERPALGYDTNTYITRDGPPHADDEWFDYEIQVLNGTVTTRVDGELLVSWTQPADWSDADRKIASGTFALQAHDPDSKVYFKDITVQVLE